MREDRVGQAMTGRLRDRARSSGLAGSAPRSGFEPTSIATTSPRATALNSGQGTSGLLSPKVSAVFGPWAGTELYANAGMGFHSNDARGAGITVDPDRSTGQRVTPLVRAKGAEVGMRTVRVRGLQSTVSLWYLGLDSELLFVGDAGTTEPGRPSRRYGVEWTNYWRVKPG